MVSCLCELYIWSLRNLYAIPDSVIGCHSYHDKVTSKEQPYYEEKQQYIEARDMVWSPRNKRPEKLRDNLKEVEDLLSQFHCVDVRWKSNQILQVVLSNGCIISFVVSAHSGDVEKILLDKSVVGKFYSDLISSAHFTDQFLIASFPDSNKLDYVYFTKRPSLVEAAKRLDKLAAWEPKIIQVDIPGPKGRRLDRKFSANIHHDHILVWWMTASDEAWPWSPVSTDKDRANLVVLHVNGPSVDVLHFTRTESDPLHAKFSHLQSERLFTVEQSTGSRGEIILHSCIYDIIKGKIQRTSIISITLKSNIVCESRNPAEDKLLLGCVDASLVMHDDQKKITQITRCALKPACMAWHPTGTIVFVASGRGDIQIFDMALSPLRIQLVEEDPNSERLLKISRFFRFPPVLNKMEWCPFDPQSVDSTTDYVDSLYFVFDKGPPLLLQFHLGVVSRERFSSSELVKEYIKFKQLDEAVSLLSCLNWDSDGPTCYYCLSTIANHLLRLPLNAEREAQLEATLATFYTPTPPISEAIIFEYRDPISRLARRFFHHLLRYARFDKAFLLAVDIGARDLYMDIYYMALDKGETALADVAKRKAQQVDSESLDGINGIDSELTLDDVYIQELPIPTSQYQQSTTDRLPRSRQHPWQHDRDYCPPSLSNQNIAHNQNNHHNSFPGDLSEFDQLGISSDLVSDYTNALLAPSFGQHGQTHETDQVEDDNGHSVKVIHFGIV
ncbi:WD repeat-containing and planar cell polarity effector protein fritz homolog isoform X1 [Patella vulgata]|uniref:WD repeat-containing and planar cell polarity effector protein fritz homolog isoform X1 n=1 Tax=Patella vulgata TaxID=6465 RepID=UPI00217FB905|nr:WD repeat-containing and planar cell polarity effector protein fritz homolog isoform X1 [Patella vulgata]XP_050405481.1 WD repeat-containing and planar cell polarity effector protein fritz homolog isoform X1 [Patella vulgata]